MSRSICGHRRLNRQLPVRPSLSLCLPEPERGIGLGNGEVKGVSRTRDQKHVCKEEHDCVHDKESSEDELLIA